MYAVELEKPMKTPCDLVVRWSNEPGSPWRQGRVRVDENGEYNLMWIVNIAEGDHVYRVGEPTTPSLEERIAMLERIVLSQLPKD